MINKFAKLLMAGALAMVVAGTASADVKGLSDTRVEDLNAAPPVYSVIETKKHERTFRQQPPMIPHQIDKYEIDMKVNECLKCHDWRNAGKEMALQVPDSHYKDRDGNQYEDVYRGRWFCTQCHATQTDARPLIENTFQSSR